MNIGYNKSNEQYIQILEEQNRIRKESLNSREQEQKKKIAEKEKGFNIHINGANEERIREQRKNEVLRGATQNDSHSQQRMRRMWKNPGSSQERQDARPPQSVGSNKGEGGHHPKYHNPFDLKAKPPTAGASETREGGNRGPRKRWGEPSQQQEKTKKQEEEEYSDSFEEINQDAEKDSLEGDEVPKDRDDLEEKDDIEQFLRTATHQDIAELKNSLSNFQGFGVLKASAAVGQKKEVKGDDEDYIEEEFEDNVDSEGDDASGGSESSAKLRELEKQRKILQSVQSQVLVSKNIATTARQARNRPISATFNLEATKKQQNTQRNMNLTPYEASGSYQQFNNFASSQLTNQLQPSYSQASVLHRQEDKSNGGPPSSIMDTPKQPNDFMKKPINTNPFRRPFSQNIPMRKDIQKPEASGSQVQSIREAPLEEEKVSSSKKASPQKSMQKSQSQIIPINAILSKIEKLEDWQKEKLFEILDNFDLGALTNLSSAKKQQEPMNLNFLSPPAEKQTVSTKGNQAARSIGFGIPEGKQELIIRVLKTYGNPHICGLTEIEVFDYLAQKILIVPAAITVRNLGQGPKNSLTKLLDGHKLTNEERHMWIGYLPMQPKNLEIVILLSKEIQIGGMKVWNYNKSAIDCTKGIKEVQVLTSQYNPISKIDEQTVRWSGILERGKGQINAEYATFIKLRDDITLSREIKPTPPKKQEVTPQQIKEEPNEEEDESSKANQEIMKKYQSEAQIGVSKKSRDPIWLASERGQPSHLASQAVMNKDVEAGQKPIMSRRAAPQVAGNTFDLLGKNYVQPFATKEIVSPSSGGLQQAFKNPSRPSNSSVLGPVKATQDIVSQATQDLPRDSKQSGNNSRLQLQETNDAIKQAVNRVNNMITGINNNPSQQSKSVPGTVNRAAEAIEVKREPKLNIEDSLDNLDLFKATNLGRLLQSNITDAEKVKESAMKTLEKKNANRQQWGMSPSQRTQESQMSSSKRGNAHVLVKNPFPEQLMSSKSSIISQQNAASKKQMSFENTDDLDILDQFMTQAQPKAQPIVIDSHLTKDIPHQDFGKRLLPSHSEKISEAKPIMTYEEKLSLFNRDFIIPNLPTGQKVDFNILTTWGDMNYVGLTGIEIYDSKGQQIKIDDSQISACPPDINILPGYGGDPRTVDKLIDGNYFTNDDLHVWLTPFTAGDDHLISIELPQLTQISMIRIWNYNKSRIHSYRGARLVTCELDGKTIFRGEIQKAPGNLNDPESCCEIILFTDNESILEKIDNNDWINERIIQRGMEDTQRIMQDVPAFNDERPMTATKKFNVSEIEEIQRQLRQQKPTSLFDERPQTSAIITGDHVREQDEWNVPRVPPPLQQKNQQELSNMVKQMANVKDGSGLKGRVLELHITETWGDLFYVGLTGIEIIDSIGNPIPINIGNVIANPRDMNSMGGGQGNDYRTLDKLIDGVNNTMDDHHMWLIPFNEGEVHSIIIDLGKATTISAIRFYNYNKSEEDTLRGAKQIIMWLDKKHITPRKGITIRKAPGFVHPLMSMGHEIKLPYQQGWTTDQIIPMQRPQQDLYLFQEYEISQLPMGYVFKLNLYSTHGDFYYIGLNGIEFFDQNGMVIRATTVVAHPQSVNSLQGMTGDVRVPANLINGKNQTYDEAIMWLAPFKNTRSYSAVTNAQDVQSKVAQDSAQQGGDYRVPNYVCVVFDEPKAISAMRIWNYAKTPARGVNEFELLIDDFQIYRGFAKAAPEKSDFDKALNKDFSTVVLFTSDDKIVEKFKNNIHYDQQKSQSVVLINEKKVVNQVQKKQRPEEFLGVYNEQARPTTMAQRKQMY